MKCRMTLVTTNTVHPSWWQFTHLIADTALRYRILWRTFEHTQRATVTQLKIIYKLVNWVAFSSTLFGAKFIIIETECKTMEFIQGPLFTWLGREIVLLIVPYSFDVHVTVHHVEFLIIKPTRCTNFSNLFLEWNTTFRTIPLSVVRSFSLYTQQWYVIQVCWQLASRIRMELRSILILLASCDIYHCCVYSEKLLTTDRGTVRNM